MAEGSDDSKDGKQNGDETEKTTSDGTTQSIAPKMPVIVLPSLGVRSARKNSLRFVSPTVSVTCGSTVVIRPTKPVVSMGTKRPPKIMKKKQNFKLKEGVGVGVGTGTDTSDMDDLKTETYSLIAPSKAKLQFDELSKTSSEANQQGKVHHEDKNSQKDSGGLKSF